MAKQPQRPQQPRKENAPQPQAPRKAAAAPARRTNIERNFSAGDRALIYGREHFILMGIGLALILAGLALMTGGAMPDPNKWEPERIYSFRRITLAPISMVAGFVVIIFGIFKPSKSETEATNPAE